MTETTTAKLRRRVKLLRPEVARQHALTTHRRHRQLQRLDTPAQHALVQQLRSDITAIGRELTAAGTRWTGARSELAQEIQRRDPRQFLTWRLIRATMFVTSRSRRTNVDAELAVFRQAPDWEEVWSPLLTEDAAGCPWPYIDLRRSSGNLIHHAYHCRELARVTGLPIADYDQIFEFGAGYGSLVRVATRLGFHGRYEAYDLPEFSALQRYYLASVAEERGDPNLFNGFVTTNTRPDPQPRSERSLFIALWSLSETPLSERERWVEIMRGFSHVFFAYQPRYEGVDNHEWFSELTRRLPDHHWERWPTAGPNAEALGIRYAVGVR